MDTYLSAVRCSDKDGYLLPIETLQRGSAWKCDRCGKIESNERVEKLMKKIKDLGEEMNILAPMQVHIVSISLWANSSTPQEMDSQLKVLSSP